MTNEILLRECIECKESVWVPEYLNKPYEKFICPDCIAEKEVSQ